MFRYELVNSTRKFTIVAEIVSLLKKIYKRDAPFRAVFKVKTLAVLFSPYPREMKHIPRNLNLPPFWRLLVSIEIVQSIPTRALLRARGLSMRTHLTAVDNRNLLQITGIPTCSLHSLVPSPVGRERGVSPHLSPYFLKY